MDEEVEEVPDEEDAQARRGGGVERKPGEDIGADEDDYNGQEGDDGRLVELLHD